MRSRRSVAIVPSGVSTPITVPSFRERTPRNGVRSRSSTPASLHRERVRAHVPRRVDAPVAGCVRRAAERGRVERGVQARGPRRIDVPDVREPGRVLHLDACGRLLLLRVVRREDQVAELAEAAVGPVALLLRPVEVDRPHPEGDGLRRSPLRPDDAGRARGRALAGLALLEDHDAFRAELLREDRGPPTDRARADDDEIGRVSVRHPVLPVEEAEV